MSVTLSAARCLTRIMALIELVPVSEREWLLSSLSRFIAGSKRGSSPPMNQVHEPVHAPGAEPGALVRLDQEVLASRFLEFWTAYPRKVGKQEALRIYLKLKPDQELHSKILQAVHEQKASEPWVKDDGAFIPHPKTWLNQGRWDDEPQVHRPKFGRTDPEVFRRFISQ